VARDPNRTYGRRMLPMPTKIQVFFGSLILVVCSFFAYEKTPTFDLVGVWVIGCSLLGFLSYIDLGHQLSWNEERIWMQFDGLWRIFKKPPESSIRIADIEWIEGQYDGVNPLKTKLLPFDVMVVHGPTEGHYPNVLIHPHYVHANSVRELLHHIEYRRPGVMAPEVIAFMHSDKPF
jgi:hypothetical protein